MAAAVYNIILEQDADWFDTLTIRPPDAESGEVLDLSGWTAQMRVSAETGSATSLISISITSSADGLITISAAEGVVELHIDATATADLITDGQVRKLAYDLTMTDADGNVWRMLQGRATVQPSAVLP